MSFVPCASWQVCQLVLDIMEGRLGIKKLKINKGLWKEQSLDPAATKVLIVDDEEMICTLFAEMLKQYGYQTATETDGSKTLERLWRGRFDVLLLDLIMPGINGINLLRQLRQSFEDLPVVIVTGHGSIETAVESMQAGASEFVTKPVEASVLDIRIRKAFNCSRH